MSGISVPWLYLGMKYANFCWHKEDLNLNSMNYMHAGAAKTWYSICLNNYLGMQFHQITVRSFFNFSTKLMKMRGNPTQDYCTTSLVKFRQLNWLRMGFQFLELINNQVN